MKRTGIMKQTCKGPITSPLAFHEFILNVILLCGHEMHSKWKDAEKIFGKSHLLTEGEEGEKAAIWLN